MDIGEKIKFYRTQKGITQRQLAELSGIHPVSIRKYEAGMMQPGVVQIQRIADALEINILMLKEFEPLHLRFETEEDILLILKYLSNLGIISIIKSEAGKGDIKDIVLKPDLKEGIEIGRAHV